MIRFFSLETARRVLPQAYWPLFLLFLSFAPLIVLAPRGAMVWLLLAGLAALAVLIQQNTYRFSDIAPPSPWGWWMLAFLLYAFCSLAWSPSYRAPAVLGEMVYLSISAILLWSALRRLNADLRWALQFALLVGTAVAFVIWGFEQSFNHALYRFANNLSFDAMIWPNVPKRTEALMALLAWPLAYILWRRRIVWPALILPLFLLLLLLGSGTSRAAQLGLMLGIAAAIFMWVAPRLARLGLMVLVVSAFVLVPVGAGFIRDIPKADVAFLFPSALERLEIWAMVGDHIRAEPFLGHGVNASGTMGAEIEMRGDVSEWRQIRYSHPHNFILQLWLDFGALGVLAVISLLLGLVRYLAQQERAAQVAGTGALLCGATLLATAYGLWQAWWLAGFIVIGLCFMLITPKADIQKDKP